jgi:hypothetical protein
MWSSAWERDWGAWERDEWKGATTGEAVVGHAGLGKGGTGGMESGGDVELCTWPVVTGEDWWNGVCDFDEFDACLTGNGLGATFVVLTPAVPIL